MPKKMPIKKVLCFLVIIGIMICTIPVSVLAEDGSTVYSIPKEMKKSTDTLHAPPYKPFSPLSINALDNMNDAKVSILNEEIVAKSTAPEEEWNKTFGGPSYDFTRAVQQTTDGGYILVLSTQSYGVGGNDAGLIKTDSKGNKQWDKTFGGSLHDWAIAIEQTTDGGYILAGSTQSYGAGGNDAWLIKTDSKGNKQWDKTFGGSLNDWTKAIEQTTGGGYILFGATKSYGAGGFDAWLIKTDSKGNKQWDKTFGGSGNETAHSVQQTTDGGYILAGETKSYGAGGAGGFDAWLIKTDSKGNKQWDKTFGGSSGESAAAVQQTTDGGYILAGHGAGGWDDAGWDDAWLIKTDSKGNKQWDKTFGGSSWESAAAVQQTTDGGYILAGETNSYGAGGADAWLIKTDSKGNKQWDKTFGGTGNETARSVQQTTDGGYILVVSTGVRSEGDDVWLIKVKGDAPKLPDPVSDTPELWSDSMQLDREGETVTLDAIVSGRQNVNVGETEIYTILLSIDYSDLSSSNRFSYGVPYFETGEVAVAYDDDACRLGNVEVLYFDDGKQRWEIPEDIPPDSEVWDAAANIVIGKAIPFWDIANLLQLIFDSPDHQLTLSEEFYNENDYDVLVVPFAKVYHGFAEEQQYPIKIKVSVPLTFEKADRFNLALYFAAEIHNGGAFEISTPGKTIEISEIP